MRLHGEGTYSSSRCPYATIIYAEPMLAFALHLVRLLVRPVLILEVQLQELMQELHASVLLLKERKVIVPQILQVQV